MGIPSYVIRMLAGTVVIIVTTAATPPPPLSNVLPGINAKEHLVRDPANEDPWKLPIVVPPFEEHVRSFTLTGPDDEVLALAADKDGRLYAATPSGVQRMDDNGAWTGTEEVQDCLLYTSIRPE